MRYCITRRARRDVLIIWSDLAEQNEPAADRFATTITSKFKFLGENPYAGRSRHDIASGYRSFPIDEYLIFYLVAKPGVRIMNVIHGRRDYPQLFKPPTPH